MTVTSSIVCGRAHPHHVPPSHAGRRIGAEARLALATESLKVTGHGAGLTELSDEVLDWLAEGIAAPAPSELTQAHPWNATWNRAALRGARAQHLGPADAADRCAGVWWLRMCGSQRLEQAGAAEVWDPAELLAAAGGPPPGPSVVPAPPGAPESGALAPFAPPVLETDPADATAAGAGIA